MLQNRTNKGVKSLNIVVFVKQVPDTNDVKWTENNNIDRTKMESIMNPADRQAIEAALQIKEKTDEIEVEICLKVFLKFFLPSF